MSTEFRIDLTWVERVGCPSMARHFLAGIGIQAEGVTVTAAAQAGSGRVRKRIRVSAYHLAAWFVSNWWRLRWEPEGEGLSWKMSHCLGAAGHGYLWPDVQIAGGEDSVSVRAKPVNLDPNEPFRFLHGVDADLPAPDFEDAVKKFVDTVALRARSSAHECVEDVRDFLDGWKQLSEEILDPEVSLVRSLEARMGYDAEEADENLLNGLAEATRAAGRNAVEELAVASKGAALEDLRTLWNEIPTSGRSLTLDISERVAESAARMRLIHAMPWKRGVELARVARQVWLTPLGPVDNRRLADLCGIEPDWIREGVGSKSPMSAGIRDLEDVNALKVSLQKHHPNARRFALARIVGDHIATRDTERLLPVTDALTARQKCQRGLRHRVSLPDRIVARLHRRQSAGR